MKRPRVTPGWVNTLLGTFEIQRTQWPIPTTSRYQIKVERMVRLSSIYRDVGQSVVSLVANSIAEDNSLYDACSN